jgi:hypothetical protein
MFRRLPPTVRDLDTLLLLTSVANLLHMWFMVGMVGHCYWANCPWFSYCGASFAAVASGWSVWTFSPARVVLAAACLRARRWWTEPVSLVVSAQLVIANVVNTVAPDRYSIERMSVATFFETPVFQAVLAAVVLAAVLPRIVRRLAGGRVPNGFRVATAFVLAFLVTGYASDFVTHAAAEREVAKFVLADLMHGRPFSTLSAHSFDRFRDIGASVPFGIPSPLEATVTGTAFLAPFLVDVWYGYGDTTKRFDRHAVVVALFGKAFVVSRDSRLWDIANASYLRPY